MSPDAEAGSGSIYRAPLLLGEDTDEILSETGYSVGDVEMFCREPIV